MDTSRTGEKDRPFRPLAQSLTRAVLFWTVLCMLACGAFQAWLTSRSLEERFVATFREFGGVQSELAATLLWEVQRDTAQTQLDTILRLPYVGYAAILDRDHVFAASGEPAHASSDKTLRFALANKWGRPLGSLVIAPNLSAMRAEVGRGVALVLAQIAMLGCLILASVTVLLRRHLERPLQLLAERAGGLAAERPARPHRDEIDLAAENTARLETALQELDTRASTDALTGCRNRAYFAQRFPEELARSQRYGRPLSAVFCDIDHFKSVNDSYGHGAGDRVLAAVGLCLRDSLRASGDWIVRWGGEEFVLILPETDLVQALDAAERMRTRVAEQVAVPVEGRAEPLRVTLSFGVAEHVVGEHGEALLKRADEWLYAAKRAGRNRVQPPLPVNC